MALLMPRPLGSPCATRWTLSRSSKALPQQQEAGALYVRNGWGRPRHASCVDAAGGPLGKYSLVEGHAHGVALLQHAVEEALHQAVRADGLCYASTAAVLCP
eukprot:scaffold415_cov362-Prasinococcus_capsulatus_cf.AAC.14